ncbi:tetratricopeptide repeat protein [Aerosakkonemataceae cyanobacterium BLCC-F154]|uniref:Tetratricopeptide repeat protein n=1 Tax=Floridaenema fluviatile BLCC-F154 TaxID=3153640 RepID=A0ABV4YAA4_9CYAN
MIRLILTLLTVVILFLAGFNVSPVMAQTETATPSINETELSKVETPETAPSPSIDQEKFKKANEIAQKAIEAIQKGDYEAAETYWNELVEMFPDNPALWSNLGNSKAGQNKLEEAIADYNKAMKLAPDAPDPYLNRGLALEGLGKFEEAIADYNHLLEIAPNDALGYNNRGNAEAGLGEWDSAIADYRKAFELEPNFAFARANYALALYETGQKEVAIRTMKNLIRKYPQFPDMRAALTAALWEKGQHGEAESNWVAVVGLDDRYKDIEWVKTIRRWPSSLVAALEKFLKIE